MYSATKKILIFLLSVITICCAVGGISALYYNTASTKTIAITVKPTQVSDGIYLMGTIGGVQVTPQTLANDTTNQYKIDTSTNSTNDVVKEDLSLNAGDKIKIVSYSNNTQTVLSNYSYFNDISVTGVTLNDGALPISTAGTYSIFRNRTNQQLYINSTAITFKVLVGSTAYDMSLSTGLDNTEEFKKEGIAANANSTVSFKAFSGTNAIATASFDAKSYTTKSETIYKQNGEKTSLTMQATTTIPYSFYLKKNAGGTSELYMTNKGIIYLDLSNHYDKNNNLENYWLSNNAWFACYAFINNNVNEWFKATDLGNNLYRFVLSDSKYPKVIFCRMSKETTTLGWSSKWNQTQNIDLDSTKNKYILYTDNNDWDYFTGKWTNNNGYLFDI